MPTRSKRKPPKNAIVLGDVVFKLGVREIYGTIQGQQGIPVFISAEEHIAEPLSFQPPLEAYGSRVSAYVRTYDKSIVLDLGEDDLLVSDIDTETGEMDVTDPDLIASLFEEQKMRVIPEVLSGMGTTLITAIVAAITFFVKLPLFPFTVVPLCIAVWGIAWSWSNYLHLSRSRVYDAAGNWIDLGTGRTSLNHGSFRYRMEEDR